MRVGCGQVGLLIDAQAQLVEIGRSDAGPAVEDGRLDVAHAGIAIDAHAVPQEEVGCQQVGAAHQAGVVAGRQNDAHIDAAPARGNQLVNDLVVGNVGLLDVDVRARAADGGELGAQDLRVAGTGVQRADLRFAGSARVARLVRPAGVECEGQVAARSGMGPASVEVLLQAPDKRTADFEHQVMPLVAVFAADVHAADIGLGVIDDYQLGVARGQPGVFQRAHFDCGIFPKVAKDRKRGLAARVVR